MLFNTHIFMLVFLPLVFLLFNVMRKQVSFRAAIFVLMLASLVYYGWWNPRYLILLGFLILFDAGIATLLIRWRICHTKALVLLVLGVGANLAALCYYKYANFAVDTVNSIFHSRFDIGAIVLPIGISFFTFQKIAFLADVYQGKISRFNLLDYALFVTFFPQLIAGPIVHHSEVMPQFHAAMKATPLMIQAGITLFILGLAKKVLLADTAAIYATPAFDAAASGLHLDLIGAWSAVLAYSSQLYFDFSAYSDMAIGIGLLFGIRLPLNFNSPYKSANIIEFWRRWHMTLSRFLRDYLYIPLGGNRKGGFRRYLNLIITMVLGGIWHGAGWTFLVWGALHGIYLMINHAWIGLRKKATWWPSTPEFCIRFLSTTITFLAVMIAWVFFRAADLETAFDMLRSMAGGYGIAIPESMQHWIPQYQASESPSNSITGLLIALPMLLVAWFAPNSQQIIGYSGPLRSEKEREDYSDTAAHAWAPNPRWAVCMGFLLAACIMMLTRISEFIYYQF